MGRILLAIATLYVLAGCSAPPSVAGGKNALTAYLGQHYPGANLAVTGFEKTDGHQQNVKGADGYVTSFHATVEFAEGYRPDCDPNERIPAYPDCRTLGATGEGAPVPIGTGLTLTGTVDLKKLAKGWEAVAVNINSAKPFDMVAADDYYLKKPCPKLTDPADDERNAKTSLDSQKNKLTVSPGGMNWNGTTINEDTLKQYLDATMQIMPQPLLHVEVKKGTPLPQVQRIWRIIRWTGMCGNAVGPFTS